MTALAPRLIAATSTHALRQRVLRPHQAIDEMVYPGDNDERCVHAGVPAPQAGAWLAIVSITPQHGAGMEGDDVWRLRGMAVDDEHQGQGLGREVMEFAVAEARRRGARRLWCNAREAAVAFYERAGWTVVSERFDIAGIGPHVIMVWLPDDAHP